PVLAPENTLASIAAAADLGVDAVEIDVIGRADGTVALAHSSDALGQDDEASLDDALALVTDRRIGVQLDLKASVHERAVAVAVFVWTVDDPELAERLERLGADGIITNDPRIFARSLQT